MWLPTLLLAQLLVSPAEPLPTEPPKAAPIERKRLTETPEALFAHYPTLTAKEFSVLSGQPRAEAEKVLDVLTEQKKLKKGVTKNGSLWMWIKEDSK